MADVLSELKEALDDAHMRLKDEQESFVAMQAEHEAREEEIQHLIAVIARLADSAADFAASAERGEGAE